MAEKNVDAINDPEPPQYGALHEKADQKANTEYVDDTGRRASVAMNIVENPLQVGRIHLETLQRSCADQLLYSVLREKPLLPTRAPLRSKTA